MISIENVSVCYPIADAKSDVLSGISLVIPSHKTTVLLGGSGCGKSTLLQTILRLVPHHSGRIIIDGEDNTTITKQELRRKIGTVFQGDALFPHMTALQNIALPLTIMGVDKTKRIAQAYEMLELVGMNPLVFASRFPHQLSGGQKQRVGVARALITKPSYLLMDEPFGALDAITRRLLHEELKVWRSQLNVTILFVTHDIVEAMVLGDAIAVMYQGKIVQSGTLDELLRNPLHDVVHQLVNQPIEQMGKLVRDTLQ